MRECPQIFEDEAVTSYIETPMRYHVKVPDRPWRKLEGKKLVALTFDDGPNDATTPYLLDILYEKNAPATFFVLGMMLEANPEIALREEREGHEVESHTMWHQNLTAISEGDVIWDLNESKRVYTELLGHEPRFIRPPYGASDYRLENNAGVPLITWSVDSLDWRDRDRDEILTHAQQYLGDGGIILMHDIHATTVDAVPYYIDILRENGYEFVTLLELIKIRGAEPQNGKTYTSFTVE